MTAKSLNTGNLIGILLSAVFLLSCEDRKEDEHGDSLGSDTYVEDALNASEPIDPEVTYPEFERQERVDRIASLDDRLETVDVNIDDCVECHGSGGLGSRDGLVPRLAGQNRKVLIERMVEIDDGIRHPAGMEEVAQYFESDILIGQLAMHLSNLPDPPEVMTGTGDHLVRGEQLFQLYCLGCHGARGEGDGASRIPRIGGWDYEAVRRTLIAQKTGQVAIHEPGMRDLVTILSEDEIEAVSDYVSRL